MAPITTILGIIGPILIRAVAWVLDWIQTKDATKKAFYQFVAAWEADVGGVVKLHASGKSQLDKIREEIAAENNLKNGQ